MALDRDLSPIKREAKSSTAHRGEVYGMRIIGDAVCKALSPESEQSKGTARQPESMFQKLTDYNTVYKKARNPHRYVSVQAVGVCPLKGGGGTLKQQFKRMRQMNIYRQRKRSTNSGYSLIHSLI